MSMRYLAGYISASYNPLKVSDAPTIGVATPGSAQVSVAFTAPSNVGGGAITGYTVIVTDSSSGATFSGTGALSPIVVTGLTNGNTYTAKVFATNAYGPSAFSAPSGSFSYAPKLYSWGNNSWGEIGDGTIINRSSPVQIGALANWGVISSNESNTLAVKTDGTLWAWGRNANGELGQNNLIARSSPVQVGALTTWSTVASGAAYSLAIKTDGTLWSWGDNSYGQLGQNDQISRSSPTQVGALTTWLKISAGYQHSIATKTDGTLWSWGRNLLGELGINSSIQKSSPTQIGALTSWVYPFSGNEFSMARKTDGTLWSWGSNTGGALGLNLAPSIRRSSPVQIGALTTWDIIPIGGIVRQALAIKTDRTLWNWGVTVTGNYSSPVQVGVASTWINCSVGNDGGLAIKTDGTLWSWGGNTYGQLGLNDIVPRSSPTQIGSGTSWVTICAGYLRAYATSN